MVAMSWKHNRRKKNTRDWPVSSDNIDEVGRTILK
jgi:hypothetical protein